jgi:hypothetical protein
MTLNKREKNIGIVLGVTLLGLVLWEVVLQPYFDAISAIKVQLAAKQKEWEDDSSVFNHRKRLKPVWTEITAGGLSADQSKAETQALNSASDWAYAAGVNITALKSERTTDAGPFLIISFHVIGDASTPAIARMLYSVETATIPVRVDDMQITPRKEGTDDLTVQLSLSTLCLKPEAESSNKTSVTRTNAEEQSWN